MWRQIGLPQPNLTLGHGKLRVRLVSGDVTALNRKQKKGDVHKVRWWRKEKERKEEAMRCEGSAMAS
jgi:hypothetical protein